MMKVFRKLKSALFFEDTVSSAALIVSFTYIISAFLGLVRNRLLATYFGDSAELGIFYLADKLPSFLFSILVFTTVSSAFFPVFSEYKKKSREESNKFISNLINLSFVLYFLISILLIIFATPISSLISWGSIKGENLTLMSNLMRIILFSQIALILSSYTSSFLQSYKRFLIPSLVPLLYNVGIIVGTVFFYSSWGIIAPAIGMIIGSVLGFLIQIPFILSLDFRYFFHLNIFDPGIRKIYILVLPRLISISAQRLYILVINGFIAFVYGSPSYVVVYEFASQLQNMPVTAFGSSLSQAIFPSISDYAVKDEIGKIRNILEKYLLRLTYFLLPISILFFVLRIPIVRLLFGGDKFSWLGTNLTAYALAFFSISIWFQALGLIFNKVFYSFHDSKTPTVANVMALIISLLLSLFLSWYLGFGVWALALSFSVGSIISSLYLYFKLKPIFGEYLFVKNVKSLVYISYATLLCGAITYLLMKSLDTIVFDTTRTIPLFFLTSIIVSMGLTVYVLIGKLLGLNYYREFLLYFSRKVRSFLF